MIVFVTYMDYIVKSYGAFAVMKSYWDINDQFDIIMEIFDIIM